MPSCWNKSPGVKRSGRSSILNPSATEAGLYRVPNGFISTENLFSSSFRPIFSAKQPQQATDITAFANKIKDSGYNYRGIVEFIPFMVTRQMCSLNPFSEDFRQQCVSGLAKAQLSGVGEGDKKSWFCSEFVTDAFAKAGHPLTLAQSGWISPADLMHMRIGDVSAFKPETQLQYVGQE